MKSNRFVGKALALILAAELLVLAYLIIIPIVFPIRYSKIVEKYSYDYGVPEYIIFSVIKVESGFNELAVSHKGACGLMQLMPSTYEWLCSIDNEDVKDIFAPDENIKYGVYLLSVLYKRYGSWDIALCAYNAGMGNVDKWLEDGSFDIEFNETENYLRKIKATERVYKTLSQRRI